MMRFLRSAMFKLTKFILSGRYRIETEGLEEIRGLRRALILPNHPAYIDPPIVLATIHDALDPRPMLLEDMFENPFLSWMPKFLDAARVPNLEQRSADARAQAERAIDDITDGLRNGRNQILWPAGRVKQTGLEELGGARSVSTILDRVEDAEVILIRTEGLFGSMFSYARTTKAPNLPWTLARGILLFLLNLLFFAPRRRVKMTIYRVPRERIPRGHRRELNKFVEDWYNANGEEEPVFVPYHLLGPKSFTFPQPVAHGEVDLSKVEESTITQISDMIAEKIHREIDESECQAETKLEDLGIDSLDGMELALEVERRFGFASEDVPSTLGDLWALASGIAATAPPKPPDPGWFAEPSGDREMRIRAKTIPESFVRQAMTYSGDVICADDLAGTLTNERFILGATLMSKRIAARVEAPNVGLMLPAAVAADLAFFAIHLSGKLPVFLNWTTGPANLAHAASLMKLTHVVTSKAFIDRTEIQVEGTQYVFLEDIRGEIGKGDMIKTLLRWKLMKGSFLRSLPEVDENDPAVVLFTSGSEKAPKAVPLTHKNILSNLGSVLKAFDLHRGDSFLGFLPPFHSFGLSLGTILPYVAGGKVVHHPDPTDASGLAQKARLYRPSVIAATPTLMNYIVGRAAPEDLQSARILVFGAEKCPESLFDILEVRTPKASVLEGYGITECSPMVSCNRLEHNKRGSIGPALPDIDVMVVDPDSFEPIPVGKTGMLLVKGDNVFPGYLGYDGESPFRRVSGSEWYITGDLVRLDEDGFIFFSGRLKRFLKAGGEMISLPALEEPFTRLFPPSEEGPRVAVEGIEFEKGRHIVLFTTESLPLREANKILREEGFHGIMRLDDVQEIQSIPVLGTGKTDYRSLRSRIAEPGA